MNKEPLIIVSTEKKKKMFKPRKPKNQVDHSAGVTNKGTEMKCLICCCFAKVFGVGLCLHPICMECSIRLRIIGQSKACPQCRVEIETLYFVPAVHNGQSFEIPEEFVNYADADQYGIKFASAFAVESFKQNMSLECKRCQGANRVRFATFAVLQHHIFRVHNLTFCHLCTENVNVLSKHQKTYSRESLQKHVEGKLHEEGFDGHPKCLFCARRFYDDEAQYKHLRQDHFFCGFCEENGAENIFFKHRYGLMRHYNRCHYACNHPECENTLIAFKSSLELAIHKEKQHHEHQVSTQLGFHFARPTYYSRNRNDNVRVNEQNEYEVKTSLQEAVTIVPSEQIINQAVVIVKSAAGFPFPEEKQPAQSFEIKRPPMVIVKSAAEFPGLEKKPMPQIQSARISQSQENFPSLSTNSSVPPQQASIWEKAKAKNLFKENPPSKQPANRKIAKKKPVIKVSTVVPAALPSLPDEYTPEMQQKRSARLLSLSEEFGETSAGEANLKKEKKKKSKQVSVASVMDSKAKGEIVVSASKFQALSTFKDLSDMTSDKNWRSKKNSIDKEKISKKSSDSDN